MSPLPSWREVSRDVRFAAGIARAQPFQCLVQVTNRCNMTCSFCDFWPHGAPPRDELTTDEYRALARSLATLGCFLVSVEGGEPLLRPDIVEIVGAFAERHLPVLFTNGWFMNGRIARELYRVGVTQVGVSIDFPDQRHDAKRGQPGAFARALRAVGELREAAPHGGRQVHVMTVLMRENQHDLAALLELSAREKVGHHVTLLSTSGFRRGRRATEDALPSPTLGPELEALRQRYPHFRIFRQYVSGLEAFLRHDALPACHAGEQSFNIDHLGNVSPCIEKIDHVVGNIRREPLEAIWPKLHGLDTVRGCQDCWTACRGFAQALGDRGSPDAWRDLATRLRST